MKLREAKFRDAVRLPGGGVEYIVRANPAITIEWDSNDRDVVISGKGERVLVPASNVVYRVPEVEEPKPSGEQQMAKDIGFDQVRAQQQIDEAMQQAAALPPATSRPGKKRR